MHIKNRPKGDSILLCGLVVMSLGCRAYQVSPVVPTRSPEVQGLATNPRGWTTSTLFDLRFLWELVSSDMCHIRSTAVVNGDALLLPQGQGQVPPTTYTLHPTPYTLHPQPYTLHQQVQVHVPRRHFLSV